MSISPATNLWRGQPLPPGAALLPLSNGDHALVDAWLLPHLMLFRWHLLKTGYPCINRSRRGRVGKATVTLHSLLQGRAPKGHHIDHRNRDRADARQENLRVVSHAISALNKDKRPGTSVFRGVYWDKAHGKWCARASWKKRGVFLGRFADEREAARAYDKKNRELYGEFACLNFAE